MAISAKELSIAIKNIRELITARMLSTPVATLQAETKADREAKGPI